MNGIITVKCEQCKLQYVPVGQRWCIECIKKQEEE